MRTCDTCPGGTNCAGDNLVPVLAEVYALHTDASRNKFEILFALSEESENLFERYNNQVSRICWTRAALETIANVLVALDHRGGDDEIFEGTVQHILSSAITAFSKFPWHVSGLIGQAPDLYEEVCYRDEEKEFSSRMSKRGFVKICKKVVYDEKTE